MGMTGQSPTRPHVVYLFDKGFSYCSLLSAYSVLTHRAGPVDISFFNAKPIPGFAEAVELLQKAFPNAKLDLRIEPELNFTFDTGKGLPPATYGRLLLPEFIKGRVLYLDGDTFARHDVLPLFEMDLDGKCFACALDSFVERDLAYTQVWWSGRVKDYLKPMIKNPELIDSTRYYNTGVMVLDMDQIDKTPALRQMFDPVAGFQFVFEHSFPFNDQEWINHKAAGHFKTLDPIWNSIKGNFKTARPPLSRERRRAYAASRQDPAIVHFAGPNKPWLPLQQPIPRQEKRWYFEYQAAITDMAQILGRDFRDTLV